MTFFKNNNAKFLTITGLLIICFILALNNNTFYWADDYAVMNEINEFGLFERCLHGYYTWDGRYLTPAGFLQGVFLSFLSVKMITLFWNCCFLLSGIILFFIIGKETNTKFGSTDKFYLTLLIPVIFWLGSYSHIGQTIYWATGGAYSFSLLLGAIWLSLFYSIQKTNRLDAKAGFLLFTVIIGLTTQNLTIGFITLLQLTLLNDILKKERKNIKFNIILLLIIIGGTLFLSLAPGNFIRAKEITDSALENITLWAIIRNFLFGLFTYLKLSFVLIILSVTAAMAYIFQSGKRISVTTKHFIFIPKTKEQFIAYIDNYKYLLTALSTILPFITMPEVISPRTAIFFMFFLVIFIFRFISQLSFDQTDTKKSGMSSVIIYSLFLLSFCFILYNFTKGVSLKKEITKRELLLKNSKNKTVSIRKIDENLKSYCYDFRDFRGNDDWAVEAQKEYFGSAAILIEN